MTSLVLASYFSYTRSFTITRFPFLVPYLSLACSNWQWDTKAAARELRRNHVDTPSGTDGRSAGTEASPCASPSPGRQSDATSDDGFGAPAHSPSVGEHRKS